MENTVVINSIVEPEIFHWCEIEIVGVGVGIF